MSERPGIVVTIHDIPDGMTIAQLAGALALLRAARIVVDCGGIGLSLLCDLRDQYGLPVEAMVKAPRTASEGPSHQLTINASLKTDIQALAEQQRDSAARLHALEDANLATRVERLEAGERGPGQLVPDIIRRLQSLEEQAKGRPESRFGEADPLANAMIRERIQSLQWPPKPVTAERLDWTIDSQHLVLDGEHLIPWEVIDAKRKERDLYARPAQKPERKRIKADRAYIEGPDDDIADRFDGQWQGKYFLTSGPHGEGRLYEFTNPKRHFNGLPVYEWNRVTDPEVLKTHGVLT